MKAKAYYTIQVGKAVQSTATSELELLYMEALQSAPHQRRFWILCGTHVKQAYEMLRQSTGRFSRTTIFRQFARTTNSAT